MIKRLLALLLCCLLLASSPGTCLAADYLITDKQLTTLEQNSITLREKAMKLENSLAKSEVNSETALKLVKKYQQDSEKLQIQLAASEKKSALAVENYEASQKSLTKTMQYIGKLENENNRLKAENGLLKLVSIALGIAAILK